MNIKCNQRSAYQLCQQKLGPNQTLNYLTGNQMRPVSCTAQPTNDAPTFTEWGTVTGHLTTVLQKAARAGLSLCTYTEMVGKQSKGKAPSKICASDKTFLSPNRGADRCPPREASRGISALPTERQLADHKLSPTL